MGEGEEGIMRSKGVKGWKNVKRKIGRRKKKRKFSKKKLEKLKYRIRGGMEVRNSCCKG